MDCSKIGFDISSNECLVCLLNSECFEHYLSNKHAFKISDQTKNVLDNLIAQEN